MRKMKLMAGCLLGATLLAFAGCTPGREYVKAERLTYDAIAPEYLQYVEADESLDAAAKQRRRDTVETWRLRIEAAEGDK